MLSAPQLPKSAWSSGECSHAPKSCAYSPHCPLECHGYGHRHTHNFQAVTDARVVHSTALLPNTWALGQVWCVWHHQGIPEPHSAQLAQVCLINFPPNNAAYWWQCPIQCPRLQVLTANREPIKQAAIDTDIGFIGCPKLLPISQQGCHPQSHWQARQTSAWPWLWRLQKLAREWRYHWALGAGVWRITLIIRIKSGAVSIKVPSRSNNTAWHFQSFLLKSRLIF